MPTLTFFPLGNADCCRIDLDGGAKLLFDYANCRDPNDPQDLRIDLADALRADLTAADRQDFDVVAFTHADDDHIHGAAEFFYLEHAQRYQGDGRIKIQELWVPAAMIVETGLAGDARIVQAEARHRLRTGAGIRVFSRPAALKDWLAQEGIRLEDRAHLITDAGQMIPGFGKNTHGVEFFVHSPFAARLPDGTLVDRNNCSLIVQATFIVGAVETRLMLSADAESDLLTDIVTITEGHRRAGRLNWDVFKLPHHCSYGSLNKDDKGKDLTQPVPAVRKLFETYGAVGGIIVSPSKPIPRDDADNQPPHRQAANYYRQLMAECDGEFLVTMEHPNRDRPAPLVILIGSGGAKVQKRNVPSGIAVISRPAPRAG